jgi:hypothetical protein
MTVVIDTAHIEDFQNFYTLFPARASRALSLAINDTIREVLLPQARTQIMAEVRFPEGYLNDDRLGAEQWSNPDHLEAIVTSRDRPTSLARFALGSFGIPEKGQPWIPIDEVQVQKTGAGKRLGRAFLVPLNNGNVGLAVRLRKGEQLRNVRDLTVQRELFPGTFLLYAPSVDQVFSGVAEDLRPAVMLALENEFYRQMERLSR